MKRGRPKGGGKRWTYDADAGIWSYMKFVMWRDGHSQVRRAAHTLVSMGVWHANVRDGKIWESKEPTPEALERDKRLAWAHETLRPGDERTFDPAEVFRSRYYAAERRRKRDEDFRVYSDYRLYLMTRKAEGRGPGEGESDSELDARHSRVQDAIYRLEGIKKD